MKTQLKLAAMASLIASCEILLAQQEPAAPASTRADQLRPALVDVSAARIPLRDALKQIESQTGFQITLGTSIADLRTPRNYDQRLVTLKVSQGPLWQTLLSLISQAAADEMFSMSITDSSGGTVSRLSGRMLASGPFLIVGQRFTHDVNYRRLDSDVDRYSLALHIIPDSSLHLTSTENVAHVRKALDESDRPFPALSPDAELPNSRISMALRRSLFADFPSQIILPARSGARAIKVLEGIVPARIASKIETVEVTGPGNLVKDYDEFHFECKVAAFTGSTEGCNVTLIFTRPPAIPKEEWGGLRGDFQGLKFTLTDASGTSWPITSTNFVASEDRATTTVGFARDPQASLNDAMRIMEDRRQQLNGATLPSKTRAATRTAPTAPAGTVNVTVEFSRQTIPIEIPFSFQNIPLR